MGVGCSIGVRLLNDFAPCGLRLFPLSLLLKGEALCVGVSCAFTKIEAEKEKADAATKRIKGV